MNNTTKKIVAGVVGTGVVGAGVLLNIDSYHINGQKVDKGIYDQRKTELYQKVENSDVFTIKEWSELSEIIDQEIDRKKGAFSRKAEIKNVKSLRDIIDFTK